MRTLKLILEYDGRDFFGYQTQKNHRTVQNELEKALQKLFRKKTKTRAAGRTDSGVHAEGQVVHFQIASRDSLQKIQYSLNHFLPKDMVVAEVSEAPKSFHAQYSAKWKLYEYRVLNSKQRSPLQESCVYRFPYKLNLIAIKKAAKQLVGKHDFRAFESSGARRASAVRTIQTFEIKRQNKMILFLVKADGFLYKMVRSMVGTLLEIGSGKKGTEIIKKILSSKDRHLIGPTAPAHGLTLKKVYY